jgi:tRNA 2-thiouridine synthesizing protein A
MKAVKTVDCRAMICPEPILHMKTAMSEIGSGDVVEMLATDKGSVSDMASWSRRTGHQILEQKEENGVFHYWVQKK